MALKKIIMSIPEDVLNVLRIDNTELMKQMRFEIAKKYYTEHNLSLGKAALLANLDRIAFFERLMKENIIIYDYDEEDLNAEFLGVEK
jgi:predicted HTH domain antitoxin